MILCETLIFHGNSVWCFCEGDTGKASWVGAILDIHQICGLKELLKIEEIILCLALFLLLLLISVDLL